MRGSKGEDDEYRGAWIKVHQKRLLDKGKIERLVGALRCIESDNPEVAEKIRTEADYLERNAERMRYPKEPPQNNLDNSRL